MIFDTCLLCQQGEAQFDGDEPGLCIYCQQDAERWLEKRFQFEFCTECGGDADDHTVILTPTGVFFAYCDWPIREDISDRGREWEIRRRHSRQSRVEREFVVNLDDPRDIDQLRNGTIHALEGYAQALRDAGQTVYSTWLAQIILEIQSL